MPLARKLRLSLVVALVMACSSDSVSPPFRELVYAVAAFQCGPADGPAVEIFLTPNPVSGSVEPSTPYVRVYVAVEVNQLTEHVWPISTHSEAAAWFQPDTSTFEHAQSGYMIVNSVDSERTITGSVDFYFPDSGHVKTAFRATWLPRTVLCG